MVIVDRDKLIFGFPELSLNGLKDKVCRLTIFGIDQHSSQYEVM